MKIYGGTELPAKSPATPSSKPLISKPDSDLQHKRFARKPSLRKARNPSFAGAGARFKRDGAPSGKRTGPATPLLRWKFDAVDDQKSVEDDRRCSRKVEVAAAVSVRKLAAGLWRMQLPGVDGGEGGEKCSMRTEERLGFQSAAGHLGFPFVCHGNGRAYGSESKDLLRSPVSVSGPNNASQCKVEPPFQFSNCAMEGVTKWDPLCLKTPDETSRPHGHLKHSGQQPSATTPVVSQLEADLEQARAHIQELETERRSSKKKVEHFLRKLSEERASWRSREHEKIRAVIDDVKADLTRERKNRQRLELINSKLVNELSDVKSSAKRYMQDLEKERKARELIEEVCDELANEIGDDKAEVDALKRDSMKLRDEVEDERKMLQMAEVWREERVQMKLVDAKVMLEAKYSHMNKLITYLENFLNSRTQTLDVKEIQEAEMLQQAARAVNIDEIKEFKYVPSNPDDIYSVFEEVNFGETHEMEIEPEITVFKKGNVYSDKNEEEEEDDDDDESGWETVSHPEDQGSSFSPEGTNRLVNKTRRDDNASCSETEWEENGDNETPITEISEVCSLPTKQLKKVSSISRLWKSCPNNGEKYRIITLEGVNGRLSNGSIVSSDRGSGKGGLSPPNLVGQWSSPESENPHINRGMKGCIEWPRVGQKNSLKAKLLEARMESQKIQLRQVLKQKI